MNWIRNFVTPKLKALISKEVPDNLWHRCPECDQMLFHRELAENNFVCRHCQHHLRLKAVDRLNLLFDDMKYKRLSMPTVVHDPLKFKDLKKYQDRLKEARHKTGEQDALIAASGLISGRPAVVAVLDFDFMAGSMGLAVGEGLVQAAKQAIMNRAALVVCTASGGARMQEGILSLMQMARVTIAINELKDYGLPYIVILTNPTTGGVTASFAMIGDIHIAEPKATICFAGRRVIEMTIKQQLPEEFQTAEYLEQRGMIDLVIHRKDLAEQLGITLNHLMNNMTTVVPLSLN